MAGELGQQVEQEPCDREDHTWVAFFLQSGRLAYWRCEVCGLADRATEPLPERLDTPSGWVERPPKRTAHGACPPASTRKWATTEGSILYEDDPSSTDFMGVPIPGLAEAHSYVKRSQDGEIQEVYEASREQPSSYYDHYWLTRFQVVGETLVRFEIHCYEESTYGIPNASEPRQVTVISGLRPLRPQTGTPG